LKIDRLGTWTDLGRERASDDIARTDHGSAVHEGVFVHTRATDRFLSGSPEYPFVVGAKGTGKSLLLFKKKVATRSQSGVIVLPEQGQRSYLPSNEFAELVNVTPFWKLWTSQHEPDLPKWALLWEWALLRTVLVAWSRMARSDHESVLTELCGERADDDPYDNIYRYLTRAMDEDGRARLRMPEVQEMRNFLRTHAQRYPPTYIFIDNQDDFFSQNPKFWVASAMGCFMAVNDVRTHSNHRVHALMSLRPEVVMRLSREERFAAHLGDIVHTAWSDRQLIELLDRRICMLRPDHLRAPDADRPIAALLGPEFIREQDVWIRNELLEEYGGPEIHELVDQYLLRHTLRRPRDIITIGNRILSHLRERGDTHDAEGEVRLAVNEAGHDIGRAYISEVTRLWPWHAEGCGVADFVRDFLANNIISRAEADAIRARFAERHASAHVKEDPLSVLFCLGLIGYPVTSERRPGKPMQHFEPAGSTDLERRIPDTVRWHLVHPVLYSGTYNVKPLPGIPVGPGLPFSEPARAQSGLREAAPRSPEPADTVFTWVHVSDLHMGAGSEHHRLDCKLITSALLRDVQAQGRRCDALFFTGDLAFSAARRQFDDLRAWLEQLVACLGVEREQVHVVPGNHDVRRAADPVTLALHEQARARSELDWLLSDARSNRQLKRKFRHYLAFRAALYGEASPRASELDWVLPSLATERRGALVLVGLNSAWVSDELDGGTSRDRSLVPNLLLSRRALDAGFAGIGDNDLVIILSHHPLHWLDEASRNLLQQYSSRAACIHVSGHCHQSSAEQRRRFGQTGRLVSLAAGATHAGAGERTTNRYAWGALRYDPAGRRWQIGSAVREYFPEQDAFVASLGFDTDDGFLWEPIELGWAPPRALSAEAATPRRAHSGSTSR
jgi:calcineurin-like phosphoesterase family protein